MANSNGWGDGAANNSIGWGQGANNAIAWGDSHAKSWAGLTDIVGITTDPAASAYFASTGITGATQQTAIDNLVKGLKSDGLWSKMKAVYPFVTDNRNLISYSEDFSNAYWARQASTISANTTTAPNGTNTADSLIENSANADHYVSTTQVGFGQNGNNTFSIYAKANTRNWLFIYINNGVNSLVSYFNLSNGTIGTVPSGLTASIENVGNGWYRCSITRNWNFASSGNGGYGIALNDNVTTYAGNGTSGIYIWGAQVELGSTATTYQPIATTQQAFISNQFKYNLVNPVDSDAAFRLVFNGGWTHSANGATPNGTNGYADTKLIPNTNLTLNSCSFSVYSRNNVTPAPNNQSFGVSSQASFTPLIGTSMLTTKGVNSYAYNHLNPDLLASAVNQNLAAMFITTRTAANNAKSFRNTTQLAAVTTQGQTTQPTTSFTFGAFRNSTSIQDYATFEHAFAHIGDGLTDTEAANLYSRVQALQTALNRQV